MTHTKATAPALLPPTAQAPTLTRLERIGAWAVSALRDLVYDGAVALWSIVAFTILVTGVALTVSLIVLIIGVFVWVGFVYVVRTVSSDPRTWKDLGWLGLTSIVGMAHAALVEEGTDEA